MKKVILLLLLICLSSCNNKTEQNAFNGRLDVDIIKVVAKTTGEIDTLLVDEGDNIEQAQILALIDTERLTIQKQQQRAQLMELIANQQSLAAQIKQINAQIKLNNDLVNKTSDLVKKGAATTQKLDEINTQKDVLEAQLEAAKANQDALKSKYIQMQKSIEIIDLNIKDSKIASPLNATVINRYINQKEWVTPGRILFDLANLAQMNAIIYVPLSDLNRVVLGQIVSVRVDGIDEDLKGKVSWIASEAEFTPKTIITAETRTSLVYAVKIKIDNEARQLKKGMPVDVIITQEK